MEAVPRAAGNTVAAVLRRKALERPDERFLKVGAGNWLTYAELDASTDRVTAGLSGLGVAKGDRVAVVCDNRLEAVELIFACAKLGAIEVPLNYYLRGEFIRSQLENSGATTLITDEAGLATTMPLLDRTDVQTLVHLDRAAGADATSYSDLSGPLPPDAGISAADIVSIVYSSGTTGTPKGCMLSNGYYVAAGSATGRLGYVIPGDRMFTAFPHYHVSFQLNALMSALVNDASIVWEPVFQASTFMRRAAEEEASMIWGIPAMAIAVLAQEPSRSDPVESLRLSSFAPLHPDRQLEFERRFGGTVCSEAYGQTEAVPITITSPTDPRRSRASLGRPSAVFDVRVLDEDDRELPAGVTGQIVARPRRPYSMFSGYWRNPEATVAAWRNLWHHTGDLGRFDEDGCLYFVDRVKDAIRRRGENISCFELEQAIALHAAVAHVAACAVPSALGEDDVKVSIVCRPGEDADEGELLQRLFLFFREQLPYFAIPRYVEFRSSLPLTATGRVRKDTLRAEGIHDGLRDLEAMGLTVPRAERRG